MRASLVLAVATVLGLSSAVEAQERVRISVNAGAQAGSQTVSQSFQVPVNLEQASIASDIELSTSPMFDIGGSYHLIRGLWIGAAFSLASRTADGEVTAGIPHPLFFNRPRPISGTAGDLESKERSIHISALYVVPLSGTLDLTLSGGPSHFNIRQDLITDVDLDEVYPYDTATFSSAPAVTVSESTWGFHAGADVTWKVSKLFGIGGVIRYSHGSTTLSAAPGNEASIDAGGVLLGGGLRVRF